MLFTLGHCSSAVKKSGPKVFGCDVRDREGHTGGDCFKEVKMTQAKEFNSNSSVWLRFNTLMVWGNIYVPGVVF